MPCVVKANIDFFGNSAIFTPLKKNFIYD
jgi:hypothetical protein